MLNRFCRPTRVRRELPRVAYTLLLALVFPVPVPSPPPSSALSAGVPPTSPSCLARFMSASRKPPRLTIDRTQQRGSFRVPDNRLALRVKRHGTSELECQVRQ